MSNSLSSAEARKLVLTCQKLPPPKATGNAVDATQKAIEHLNYVQIDTISVVQRAHHHTLWNRNPRYRHEHLDHLLRDRQVFEYWAHAAAYLPMRDYRYSLPKKRAIAQGQQKHWYPRDKKLMNSVLKRIRNEGPLLARDFEHSGKKIGEWQSKPAKRALECLFMQGDLMTSSRENFHKVYDLTERVLPDHVNTSIPTPEEYARFLIERYLHANGLGQAAEISYLLKNVKPLVSQTLQDMFENKEVLQIKVGNHGYYALPETLALLNKPLARSKLKILSPFDNLLIQRKRALAFFDFDYQIECYVPASKRQFGYFSLPVLWDGRLVARMDCKAERRNSKLGILHCALESSFQPSERFLQAFSQELRAFMRFNECASIQVHKTTPGKLKKALQTRVSD